MLYSNKDRLMEHTLFKSIISSLNYNNNVRLSPRASDEQNIYKLISLTNEVGEDEVNAALSLIMLHNNRIDIKYNIEKIRLRSGKTLG